MTTQTHFTNISLNFLSKFSSLQYSRTYNQLLSSLHLNLLSRITSHMHGLSVLLLILVVGFVCPQISHANCAEKHGATTSEAKNLPYTKTLTLTGMSCENCVKNVNAQLAPLQKSLGDLISLKVDINSITIDYSKNKNLTEDQLNKISNDLKSLLAQTKYKVVEG